MTCRPVVNNNDAAGDGAQDQQSDHHASDHCRTSCPGLHDLVPVGDDDLLPRLGLNAAVRVLGTDAAPDRVTLPEVRGTVAGGVLARREAVTQVVSEGAVEAAGVSRPVCFTETSPVNVRTEGGALGVTVTALAAVLPRSGVRYYQVWNALPVRRCCPST